MSYTWQAIENQPISNRVRYNLFIHMRKNNIAGSRVKFEGMSPKTLFNFMSGLSSMTIHRIELLCEHFDIPIEELVKPIPLKQEHLSAPYRAENQPEEPEEEPEEEEEEVRAPQMGVSLL